MIRPALTLRRKRIVLDLGTQRDLFTAGGIACVRNHRRVLANIRRVMAWARHDHIRVISTVQIHEKNGNGNGNGCKYLLAGTDGVKKISYTLRQRHIDYPSDGYTDFARDVFDEYDQIVIQIRSDDPFDEPRADRILSEVRATDFIVVGGPTESVVKWTVLGLLLRRRNVIVITDAVGSIEKNAAEIAMRQMQAKGAKFTDSKTLFGSSRLQLVGTCECDRCQGRIKADAAKDYE